MSFTLVKGDQRQALGVLGGQNEFFAYRGGIRRL